MTFGATSTLRRKFSQRGRLKSSDVPWTQSVRETSTDKKSCGDSSDAIAESLRELSAIMPRRRKLTTRKPTDSEVYLRSLESLRTGVSDGIYPFTARETVRDLYLRFPDDMKALEEAEAHES